MKKGMAVGLVLVLVLALYIGVQGARAAEPQNLMDVISSPTGVAATEDGALLVTDVYNKCVWLVRNGHAVRYAGAEEEKDWRGEPFGGFRDGALDECLFQEPWAITPFLEGYAVSDAGNNALRLITDQGVRTINGWTREKGLESSDLGVVLQRPTGLATDAAGNLYVANTDGGTILRISTEGEVTTFCRDLTEPMGLCWKDGVLYVAETGAHRIVKIAGGKLTVVAGAGEDGYEDGPASSARFSWPSGVTVDDKGTVYVADTVNSAIRRVAGGEVDTLLKADLDRDQGFPASPRGLLFREGKLYICDPYVQKLIPVEP